MRLNGLSSREVERSRKEYGLNNLTPMPPIPFIKRFAAIFKNPFILVIVLSLIIQTVVFLMGHSRLIVPLETLLAIIIISVVSAVSEGKNKRNAENAYAEEKIMQSAKVVRDGSMTELQFGQIVVGDMIFLQAGDKIPADGEIVYGKIIVDQTSLGGVSGIEKIPAPEKLKSYDTNDLENKYYVHRESVVCSGEAYMYVKAVGDKTLFGRRAKQNCNSDVKKMPEINLDILCKRKAFFGYVLAICILIAVLISIFINGTFDIYVMILAVSGLLSVTAEIGYFLTDGRITLTEGFVYDKLQKLSQKHIFVKDINILAKTDKINVLLIDRTGVFTDAIFFVSELATGDGNAVSNLSEVSLELLTEICIGIGINNSANVSGMNVVGGDRTDKALLSYLINSDVMGSVIKQNAIKFNGYNREKKYSDAIVSKDGRNTVYIKGEAKTVLNMCNSYINTNGVKKNLDCQMVLSYISKQAILGNRIIAAAKSDNNSYTLICIVSLKDTPRPEISEFVKNTNIQIVMITSDSKECAAATAENAGLIENSSDFVLTSSEITEEIMPELKVAAELTPKDKLKIVSYFKKRGICTAILADSVYDIPALEAADVGIALQNSSEAVKQASDIIILDDNILSLKKILK